MPRGRKKGNPFDSLDADWKSNVENMRSDEIKVRVAEIALELDRLMEAKKEDQDLKEKTEAAKEAGRVYREGKKGAELRIRYAQTILEARGEA